MAAIPVDFGDGGATSSSQTPSLAGALRDLADDVAGIQVATIASADATDLAEALTLVNEIKASLNVVAAYTVKTTKA